ncbi:sigma-70 family RNA polymerase sigma factor [Flavobacterium praedii]|uniref:sigma-70 family RNA polymerase sigma factor n=1 Tax=Flavobacterium praedii TaxID=3002900 RepID=UPI002481CC0E|nr:sigma-70 family RNA polymerase sigma factor [Flavobacterium praedii]
MKKECCNINEVVNEFYIFLKNFIYKKVQNSTIAEDIVQDVMMKLVESHQKNKAIKNVKAWLFQVTRNTIHDYFNSNNIIVDSEKIATSLTNPESKEFELSVFDHIIPMIQLLPKKYSEPLHWSDIDKIPQIEIAKRLNLTHSATKMRIQRARIKLKDLFIECCDIEYDSQGNFINCIIKKNCDTLQNHLNNCTIEFEK